MFDREKEICVCNDKNIQEIAQSIKDHNITTLEELLECEECDVGNKCESCHEEGFHNDGYSLAMVLGLVKQGRL